MKGLSPLVFGRLFGLTLLIWVASVLPGIADKGIQEGLDKKPVKVDFHDVDDHKGHQDPFDDQLSLSIAVAAMISPHYTYTYYVELLRLIGEKMGYGVRFIQKKTYSEVNDLLEARAIDVAFVCSGPYVAGKERFGMEIIAVPVCHGETVYYSYFITSTTSGIRTFDGLKGRIFAFTDPLSNTGTMVPRYVLAQRGETPETFFKRTFFTHSHDNSIRAVARQLADGAAVDSLIYDFIKVKKPELTEKTVIVEKSPPYGIPPVVVHPAMDQEIKEKLKYVFLTIHTIQKGKAALNELGIDRFAEGDDRDYDSVRNLQSFLDAQGKTNP